MRRKGLDKEGRKEPQRKSPNTPETRVNVDRPLSPVNRKIIFLFFSFFLKNQNQLPTIYKVTLRTSVHSKVERKGIGKYVSGKSQPQTAGVAISLSEMQTL